METKISDITINKVYATLLKIQTLYPEAYKLLDEDPITLISDTNRNHTEALNKRYLKGLNAMLESFKCPIKKGIKT